MPVTIVTLRDKALLDNNNKKVKNLYNNEGSGDKNIMVIHIRVSLVDISNTLYNNLNMVWSKSYVKIEIRFYKHVKYNVDIISH